jgi:hypothetical protein
MLIKKYKVVVECPFCGLRQAYKPHKSKEIIPSHRKMCVVCGTEIQICKHIVGELDFGEKISQK